MRVGKHEKFHEDRERLSLSYVGSFFTLAILFAVIVVGFFGFYVEHWYQGSAGVVARVFPIPAVVVEGDVIWYGDVVKMAGMMDAFQKEAGVEEGDPFNTALKRLINDKQLEQFGESLGVQVESSAVEHFELDQAGLAEFLSITHWSESDYRKYIVTPLLIAQEVETKVFEVEDLQIGARERIEKVVVDLESGFDFTDIATTRSDDLSSINAGHLGYLTEDELPEIYKELFNADLEEVSEILEGEDFFAIAKVVDVSGSGEERVRVALQVITINKDEMSTAFTRFKDGREIRYFVK